MTQDIPTFPYIGKFYTVVGGVTHAENATSILLTFITNLLGFFNPDIKIILFLLEFKNFIKFRIQTFLLKEMTLFTLQ